MGSVSSRPAATATCCTAWASTSPGDDAGDLRHGGQLRVVLDGHRRQAEPAVAARDRGARAVHHDVHRLGGQRAGDVGQQPPGHQHPAGVADRRVQLDAGGGLVVEAGDREAVAGRAGGRLEEHSAQDRDRRTGGQAAGDPRSRVGQDVAFDPELHGGCSCRLDSARDCRARTVAAACRRPARRPAGGPAPDTVRGGRVTVEPPGHGCHLRSRPRSGRSRGGSAPSTPLFFSVFEEEERSSSRYRGCAQCGWAPSRLLARRGGLWVAVGTGRGRVGATVDNTVVARVVHGPSTSCPRIPARSSTAPEPAIHRVIPRCG